MIMHFRKDEDTGVRGKQPYLYRRDYPTARMSLGAYKKEYSLQTGDWFECGKPAYSLHPTEESARKFRYMRCWSPHANIEQVFVSKKTLEVITKSRDGRRGVRGVFVSLES